jgi:hypothetical protein
MVTGLAPQVGGHVGGEDLERAAHHPDGTVGMPAGATTIDLLQPAHEPGHQRRVRAALRKSGEIIGQGGQTEHARSALARALERGITGDPSGLNHAAGRRAKDDDDADSR